jgi:hypothetical protein
MNVKIKMTAAAASHALRRITRNRKNSMSEYSTA